jgi:hypothetical protein
MAIAFVRSGIKSEFYWMNTKFKGRAHRPERRARLSMRYCPKSVEVDNDSLRNHSGFGNLFYFILFVFIIPLPKIKIKKIKNSHRSN